MAAEVGLILLGVVALSGCEFIALQRGSPVSAHQFVVAAPINIHVGLPSTLASPSAPAVVTTKKNEKEGG